ncbi:PucR family transcriptional regulator ligand-binding domain-containing protein [Lysinibacillus xylanilyticus]|uniref:PucR family transcriptional regulator n=1 Tax=Lysinibacillus xylanilyticus TaxID=582475 RepID=UPI002B240357|nr:PucR family transcriptional regulator ligand-binding domain-containing protein [Lysinibacillus xylanilyticus]MEB2279527.1 PucR family transcriptional regulator ligand-binding domain-containing protein [Lysinibacillus xylanilyticus]
MTTLKEIMSVQQFSDLTLLNDKGDLERVVEMVDITETPDIKDFTAQHSFIVTTGMCYQDNQSGLIDLIRELNDIQVAGIGIKLSRFLKKLDDEVIEFANELKFPVISIPDSWNLGSITHHISSYILDEETEKLYFALDIQQELNTMLMRGLSLEMMIERMSRLLRVPVMLLNPLYQIKSMSHHFNQHPENVQKNLNYFKRCLNSKHITPNNREAFQEEHIIFEVPAFKYFPYYLMVSNVNTLNYPFSLLAIEQAVNTLSLAIYKNSKIKEAEQQDVDRFFESLMSEHPDNLISVKQHPEFLKKHHIQPSNYYQVIICAIDKEQDVENNIYLNERYQMTFEWLTHKLIDIDPTISIYTSPGKHRFTILLQTRHQYYLDYCKYLNKEYQKFFNNSLSFGIGNEVSEFSQLPLSYFEANEAFDNKFENGELGFIELYKSKSVEELLQLIPANKLKPFITYTLGSLAYPKTTKEKELKHTLKVYLANHCDLTKTSEDIFIHRNTVKYRIKKCEEILGQSVEASEASLDIRLALFASEKITF